MGVRDNKGARDNNGAHEKKPIRILIADHHRIVRSGIRIMLAEAKGAKGFEIDEASTCEEVLGLIRANSFTLVLLATTLPGMDKARITELILQRSPGTQVLGMMESPERDVVEALVAAGAKGCILTTIEPDTLVSAIRTVLSGRQFYSNEIALCLLEPGVRFRPDPRKQLTPREHEVLQGILNGLGNKELAERLGISKRTVDKHREHLNEKLGVRNAIELIQAAIRLKLISTFQGPG